MTFPTQLNRSACFLASLLIAVFVSNVHPAQSEDDILSYLRPVFTFGKAPEAAGSSFVAPAGISLTAVGVPYTENFDSLAPSGPDILITEDVTIPGLFVTRPYYSAGNGSTYAATNFSFGTSISSSERAFGSITAGSSPGLAYGLRFVNNTGTTITSLDVSYFGEQWRRSNNANQQTLEFAYRQAPTITDLTGEYVSVPAMDFTTPIVGATSAIALNGNLPANRVLKTGSIDITVPPGEAIMLRWSDANHNGEDHALAIDDFSVTPRGAVVPTLSIADVSQTEGNAGTASFDFEVALSAPAPAGGVSFDIATQDGTATDGNTAGEDQDYVARSITGFSIPEGETAATFAVTVNGDTAAEPNESFSVLVTNVSGANSGDLQATGQILNDDTNIYLSNSNYTIDESSDSLSVVVNRDGRGNIPVSALLSSSDGTATAGASCSAGVDFVTVSSSVSFAAGEVSKVVPITVCNDEAVEGSETFSVSLSAATGGATIGNPASAAITINEVKGEVPVITLSTAIFQGREGDTVSIVVNRSGSLGGPSSVNYHTTDGTAIAGACPGADFVGISGTLLFSADESTKTIPISLCHDSLPETEPETFDITLSLPQGAVLSAPSSATVTVYDVARYENSTQILFPDGGWAVSTIDVAGHQGNAMIMRLYLNSLSIDAADDLEAVVVSPAGTAFVLAADVGGLSPLNDVNLTLQDFGSTAMPDEGPVLPDVTYKPTSCNAPVAPFPAPAPAGPYNDPGCAGIASSLYESFGGENPNGTWSLYLRDDAGTNLGGTGGSLGGGWALEFVAPTAAAVELGGRVICSDGIGIGKAAVRIEGGDLSEPRTALTNSFGFYNFAGLTAGMTYVVTVSSKRYAFAIPSQAIVLNDSLDNADFIAEP